MTKFKGFSKSESRNQSERIEMLLRPYQAQIALQASTSLRQHRRVVVSCPTGSGKTVIALNGIIPSLENPILWVTHRRELARQVRESGASVSVQMVQSMNLSGDYKTVIIDEGHHVCASQYQALFGAYPNASFVALTATPYRMDGIGLGSCGFTSIIHGPDIHDLTQLGFLVPARVLVPVEETTGSWAPDSAAKQIASQKFHKAIVYCRSVSDSDATATALNSIGIKSLSIHGGLNSKDRHRKEISFRVGKTRVICNHTIFTEGYDVPSTDLIVLNRFTESRCLWRQMTGRGLRLSPGKNICTILDLAANGTLHGSIYDREIYDLNGEVESTESRCSQFEFKENTAPYIYNNEQPLKEWKPSPKPVSIKESLQRLKLKSPLHRLLTA